MCLAIRQEDRNRRKLEREVEQLRDAAQGIRELLESSGYTEKYIFEEDWNPDAHLDLQALTIRDARKIFNVTN